MNMLINFVKNIFSDSKSEDCHTIKFTGRLDLDSNAKDLLHKFAPLFETKISPNKKFILDLTETTFIYPSVVFFLVGLHVQLEKLGVELNIMLDENSATTHYLYHCGLGKIFPIIDEIGKTLSNKLNSDDVMKMTWEQTIKEQHRIATDIVDWLEKRQKLSPKVESDTIDSIDEILRNIKQHSSYDDYGFIGQAYPTSNRVRLVFYDNGIGIKAHITKRLYQNTHKRFQEFISAEQFEDMKTKPANFAIEKASIYEVSGTDYIDNSGAGLDFILRDLSPPTNGVVSIISDNGYVCWKKGELVDSFALPFSFKGTLVAICIDSKPDTILTYKKEFEQGANGT